MGNALTGGVPQSGFNLLLKPEVTPHPLQDAPRDDVEWIYPTNRKPREMIATEEEMRSARLPLEDRDFCAHKLLQFRACRKSNWPFAYRCAHEKHEFLECKYEDFIIRMKEYERERRSMVINSQCIE